MIKQALIKIIEENHTIATRLDETAIADVLEMISVAPRIFTLGQGRSGLIMRMFAMRLMHLGLQPYIVGEPTTPAIVANDLLIACSGSGATGVTCLLAEKAVEIGAKLACITAVPDSRLARISTRVICIPAPPKYSQQIDGQSIQHEGLLFEQSTLLLGDALFFGLRQAQDISSDALWARHANLE